MNSAETEAPTSSQESPSGSRIENHGPEGSSKTSSRSGDTLTQKLLLALIVAILTFAGSAVGNIVVDRLEQSRWQRETNFSARTTLLNKRIELLDRTARILTKSELASYNEAALEVLNAEGGVTLEKEKLHIESLKHGVDSGLWPPASESHEVMDRVTTLQQQQAELSAEFTSVLMLDRLYFGPKTNAAAGDLFKHLPKKGWWNLQPEQVEPLVRAMYEELVPDAINSNDARAPRS